MTVEAGADVQLHGPTHVPYEAATRKVWGDDVSGVVYDAFYASSERIEVLLNDMPVGAFWRHSDRYPTYVAVDSFWHVLRGELAIADAETGEVQRVRRGESVYVAAHVWNHGLSSGTEPLRLLELVENPARRPTQHAMEHYAAGKGPSAPVYGIDRLLGRWPADQDQARGQSRIRVLRDEDVLSRLEGTTSPILIGIILSTSRLTVGRLEMAGGRTGPLHAHAGDEVVFVADGRLCVSIAESKDAPGRWFELKQGDVAYIPEGVQHNYANIWQEPAVAVFGVSPDYRAPQL